jgi:hypothetical protein
MKPILMFFVSWLIPGSGHFLQGKRTKGIVFFCGILSLVVLGLVMHGGMTSLYDYKPLTLLGFLGSVGSGIFWLITKAAGLSDGNVAAYTYIYGTTYMAVAGFLNLLIAVKAYGMAKEGKNV